MTLDRVRLGEEGAAGLSGTAAILPRTTTVSRSFSTPSSLYLSSSSSSFSSSAKLTLRDLRDQLLPQRSQCRTEAGDGANYQARKAVIIIHHE